MPEEKNVLIVHFPDTSQAFRALSEMKDQPGVIGAAVVERTADGQLRTADGYSSTLGDGPAVGGLVGALIGVLAGPLGVLLGWTTGMVVGAAYETDEAADVDDGFTILSRSIAPGANALIVEMTETSHATADDIAAKLDGTITRVPAADVEVEVAEAQEAARAAEAEARKARREKRGAEFKEKLSSLMHHGKTS